MPYEEWYNLFYLSEVPLINTSLGGEYYIEGSPVTIICEASGKPLPNVAWIRNGVLESSGKKVAFLKFYNINRTDAGQYTCQANNSVGVTSVDTTIVVHCKYILTLIFYLWIYFIYSVNPVIGASYPKLTNLLKSARKQNSTSNPFQLCVHQSQVLIGTIKYRWNHFSHYFALEGVKIFSPSHCIRWTVFNSENGLKTILWVIITIQNSLCLPSAQG